jgi:predicted RNA binding protein YcfA (HicA-like mRNA interferase family)
MSLAESRGWTLVRVRGDHFIYRHPSFPFNLSLPGHRELRPGVLRALINNMGMTVDEFLDAIGRR